MQRPGLERQNTMSKAKGLHPGQSYAEVLAEARRLGAGQLWEDRVFSHKGDACLYDRNKPASQRQVFNGGNKIKWCRARDVKGAEASRLKLIEGTAEAGEVEQGELGDCYLLGAMSSVANLKDESGASHIRKLLKSSDADLQLGFATFLLYKFGSWVEVTVDTWLPCKSDADRALIFAQNAKEPNELWVSLLEKAYAKLHGSYESLDGGSVTAALVDLSGGVTESIDLMDDEAMIEVLDGSMFKRLQRYNKKKNYLLGAAYSRKDVKDQGGMTDTLMQAIDGPPCCRAATTTTTTTTATFTTTTHLRLPPHLQTDMGIMVNHAYTLLDVQKVGEDHTGAVKLLKLRNPWGQSEWKGPWSDDAEEWKTGIGRKAKELLNVQFGNDGTFWIAWEDFQAHFNKVYQLV